MASIFFTEPLPGTSILQTAAVFHIARVARKWLDRLSLISRCGLGPAGSREPTGTIAVEHDDTGRLPQKQGLCQVVKAADFEMLSAF
jgi:hypothetical protein